MLLPAIFFACLLSLLGTQSVAQEDPAANPAVKQGANQQVTMTFGEVFASVDQADPTRRAGLRSSLLSRSMQVVPWVVIVETPGAYLDAIKGWEGPFKYPVLYDDGSDVSREHIARFVRAFGEAEVIRFTGQAQSRWGATAQERQDAISEAFGKSIVDNGPEWSATLKALRDTGVTSPGVVVLDPMDQHWAGGLALAAGRLQPIVFMSGPMNHFKEVEPSQASAINQGIEAGLRKLGLSYNQIGDEIDSITLAMRIGAKIKTGSGDRDRLATTDQIGRHDTAGGGLRWAWCGQLFGNTSSSVYQAMCALFLPIDNTFIWDGYPTDGDWARYDGTETANELRGAGFTVEVFDDPRASLAGFKGRGASGPIDSSMIFMNTKGSPFHYDLPQAHSGLGKPGDLPILNHPSALHMVHSFSLSMPHQPKSVGGRWLERGVYLYAGSVDEPFLTGFVPTPIVAKRLLGQLPFAAAVHYDDGLAWKITVLGDPLKTFSPCGTRLPEVPNEIRAIFDAMNPIELKIRAKDRLQDSEFAGAIEDFILTDRDDAVIRLGQALMNDKPEVIDDEIATMLISAAFRMREHELVLDLFERLSPKARLLTMNQDTLWMSGRYQLLRFDDQRAMVLMRTNLREGQIIQDAEELAMVLRRESMSTAIAFMESVRADLSSASHTRALNKALERVRR